MKYVLLVVVLLVGGFSLYCHLRRKKLLEKWGDPELVDRLMNGEVWQGQTEEMLRDSLGKPVVVDRQVLKTKTKETWKYHETGKNQYKLRVILEQGEVVGWKKRG